MMIDLLKNLVNQAGIIAILAIVISHLRIFRRVISEQKTTGLGQLYMILFFGAMGIAGTYMGIPVKGAIANSRVVGVFVAGLIGGPFVGLFSGLIAGFHRWAIDIHGFTAAACALSTTVEGLLGGILKNWIAPKEKKWLFAMGAGALAEILQMVIILVLVRPFDQAWELVTIIGIPMITANALGIGMFVAIVDSISREQQQLAANQAEVVLKIANRTQQYFRKGFIPEMAQKTARIILEITGVAAVAFTDTKQILCHVGLGQDHHKPLPPLLTRLTHKAIDHAHFQIAQTKAEIGCANKKCELKSTITVPLFQGKELIGTLKLYRNKENTITPIDIKMATGLASLFSTQIELSRIEEQLKLLNRAELKALQAQINPHFLFNAINTVVSLIRTNPEQARYLLLHLGSFFRNNLQISKEEVNLEKEIEHIRSYLEIEKARFGNKLEVQFDIPRGIGCQLPPFILQPLVENAVKHGVMVRRKGGIVYVVAKDEKNSTMLTVRDNGVGMEDKMILKLLAEKADDQSIGLRNIHKRLITKYGKNYGLNISSSKGKGTSITIRIPKEVA